MLHFIMNMLINK